MPARSFALLAALLLWSGAAMAQMPFGREFKQLSPDDLRLMSIEEQKLLETGREGDVMSWENTVSGNRGTMKLGQSFERGAIPCKRLNHRIRFKNRSDPRVLQLTYCRIEGEWKLAG